ncbi:MAG: methyltransferase [Verrucomicrobiaceae bacterium]|nr:methyltransferase [Verrucomicrobiaceae bacterium]
MSEIIFILVRPAVPENVGAAARALKTMGFQKLRIVGSDVHREKPARILAHASNEILENAQTFPDLASALIDIDFSVGTSAKDRHNRRYQLTPSQLRETIASKQQQLARVGIVFGCEESGLSNAELALCDALSCIPLATDYPSLNLAQAVMLYAYELAHFETEAPLDAEVGEWRAVKIRIAQLMQNLDITADSKLARWADERCATFARDDVRFLHALLAQLEEKLKR